MTQIISFAWTTVALLAGRKSRTRREWNDDYAKRFKVGDIVQAWDKQPRLGGKKVADIKITGIKKEDIALMPDGDYEKEGFKFMEEQGLPIWGMNPRDAFGGWRNDGGEYWIVDFELIKATITLCEECGIRLTSENRPFSDRICKKCYLKFQKIRDKDTHAEPEKDCMVGTGRMCSKVGDTPNPTVRRASPHGRGEQIVHGRRDYSEMLSLRKGHEELHSYERRVQGASPRT